MVAGIHFNYTDVLKKSKKVDKKVILSSSNLKYLKKLPYSAFSTGLFLAIIVWFCTLVGVVFSDFSILDSVLTAVFVFSLGSLFSLYSLIKKMDIMSYKKLKKMSKQKYQVYEFITTIDGIYDSIGVSAETNMKVNDKKNKVNSFILMVDGEKIFLNRRVYEDIKEEKSIKLYIAKIGNLCVLFDYEKK